MLTALITTAVAEIYNTYVTFFNTKVVQHCTKATMLEERYGELKQGSELLKTVKAALM